jgi:di/tricarboxylate transporter
MNVLLTIALPDHWKISIVLGLLVLAVVLFSIEVVSVDIITLILLLALVGTGTLSVADAFRGFSDEIIIILASIFVLSGALQETGVVDAIGARLVRLAKGGENRLLLLLMGGVSGTSAFMNNTTVTAMLVGPVMGMARKAKISASRLLLPMAFASILGGTCTLIGTSTNVAVSGFIARAGLTPLGMFEITPIGLILVAVGIAYMMLIGKRLLPVHADESLVEGDAIREYLSEIVVLPGSPLIGQRFFQSDLATMDFRILKVMRGAKNFAPDAESKVEDGDTLLVSGDLENLMKVKATEGIEIKPDWKLGDVGLVDGETKIVEALVSPQSHLVGRTLIEADYRQEHGLTVLAVHRRGQSLRQKIGAIRLRVGDLLLVQGQKGRLESLQRQRELAVLAELPPTTVKKRRGLYAAGFFLAALVLGGLEVLPVSMSLLAAAVLSVLFRCIAVERAYQFIDWRLLILIGGMTAFGVAIDQTGADTLLAHWIVTLLKPWGVMAILSGFFVLTVLLTQPMSNAAAALVVLPVAMETARVLGANERTFAIAIMLAASISFITPFEPSCILVYGPGKYKFRDFVKTGAVLTLILGIVVLALVPVFWPLYPAGK